MGVSDTGRHHIIIARHILIQRLPDVFRRFIHRAVEVLRVRRAQIQKIDRIVQDSSQVHPDLVILLHTGKSPARHNNVIIQTIDLLVHLHQIQAEGQLREHDSRIRLKVNHIRSSRLRT